MLLILLYQNLNITLATEGGISRTRIATYLRAGEPIIAGLANDDAGHMGILHGLEIHSTDAWVEWMNPATGNHPMTRWQHFNRNENYEWVESMRLD